MYHPSSKSKNSGEINENENRIIKKKRWALSSKEGTAAGLNYGSSATRMELGLLRVLGGGAEPGQGCVWGVGSP